MGSAAPSWHFFAVMAVAFMGPMIVEYLTSKVKGK